MLVSFSSQGPLRHHWYAVATTEGVQDKPIAFELLREELVLWRGGSGRVVAGPDKCSHRPSNLSPGGIKDGCLVCPHHGRVFDENGHCVLIPAGTPIDESANITIYACEERYGLVWVCSGTPRTEIPTATLDSDPAFLRVSSSPTIWNAPAPRIVEALLEQGLTNGGDQGSDIPFTYHRSITSADGSEALLLVTCTPLGASSALVFPVVWSKGTGTSSEALFDSELSTITQLKPVVEAASGMYEIDENAPEGSSDGISAYRHALLEAVSAEER